MNTDKSLSVAAKAGIITAVILFASVLSLYLLFAQHIDKDSRVALLMFVSFTLILVPGAVYLIMSTDQKRFKAWQCRACGYDLRRLDSIHCPECGRELSPIQKINLRNQTHTD